jgi:hypothetical protein
MNSTFAMWRKSLSQLIISYLPFGVSKTLAK